MRRADRLFRTVQLLRGRRQPVTAAQLAERLEISERTVYRDIRDLIASGVPIRGEAGIGYVLERSFELPPVMFDRDEVSALVLGIGVVQGWGDQGLVDAATRALEKLRGAAPAELASTFDDLRLSAVNLDESKTNRESLFELRRAILDHRAVRFRYQRQDEARSQRTVHPLGVVFTPPYWLLVAWCTLRDEFRVFRTDRISDLKVQAQQFDELPGRTFLDFLARQGARPSAMR